MGNLDSAVTPVRLEESDLPAWRDHHAAKHELLRHYLAAWLPKLCQKFTHTVLIDAFASAGRYQGGRPGSPLIMLEAFLEHSARSKFLGPPHFVFLEERAAFAQHLRAEIDAISDLHGARVDVLHGTYEGSWPRVINDLRELYDRPLPTFALIDPRGFSTTPFSHIELYKRLLPRSTEAMVYLPVWFMARFANTGQIDDALTSQYGRIDWEVALRDDRVQQTSDALGEAFANGLRRHFSEVTSFRVEPKYRNAYQLLFGTDSLEGLRVMKKAFWQVDAVAGQGYTYEPPPPQEGLFALSEVDAASKALHHSDELKRQLRQRFGSDEFTIEDAELFTLRSTRFRDQGQLRPWALIPLEREGRLERVGWPVGRAKTPGSFGRGARLRLL